MGAALGPVVGGSSIWANMANAGINTAIAGGITYGADALINNTAFNWKGYGLDIATSMAFAGLSYQKPGAQLANYSRADLEAAGLQLGLGSGYGMSFDNPPGEDNPFGPFELSGAEIVAPRYYGEIRAYEPSFFDSWSEKTNFFAKGLYDIIDGMWVTSQSFVLGPDSRHMNGSTVYGNERVDGFVSTASLATAYVSAPTKMAVISQGSSKGLIFKNTLGDGIMILDRGRVTRFGYRYSIKFNKTQLSN